MALKPEHLVSDKPDLQTKKEFEKSLHGAAKDSTKKQDKEESIAQKVLAGVPAREVMEMDLGDRYDDMDAPIGVTNTKAEKVAAQLRKLGIPAVVTQADYDTDADIEITDTISVQVSTYGGYSVTEKVSPTKFKVTDANTVAGVIKILRATGVVESAMDLQGSGDEPAEPQDDAGKMDSEREEEGGPEVGAQSPDDHNAFESLVDHVLAGKPSRTFIETLEGEVEQVDQVQARPPRTVSLRHPSADEMKYNHLTDTATVADVKIDGEEALIVVAPDEDSTTAFVVYPDGRELLKFYSEEVEAKQDIASIPYDITTQALLAKGFEIP